MAVPRSVWFHIWLPSKKTWRTRLSQLVFFFLYFALRFFAISPLKTSIPCVNFVFTIFWIIEVILATFYAFYYRATNNSNSIGGVVTTVLFIAQMLAHLTMLLEAALMYKQRERILEMRVRIFVKLRDQLKRPVDAPLAVWNLTVQLLSIIVLQSILLVLFTVIKFEPIYWYSMLSAFALKFRILEILSLIVAINCDTRVLRQNIDEIGKRNIQRLFGSSAISSHVLDQKIDVDEDEQQLVSLKCIHNEVKAVLSAVNDCYGWSLLAIMTTYFLDFVSNSYWLLLGVLTLRHAFSGFIQNICFVLNDIVMLSVLCWNCQKCYNNSRYIGCLIFKLVKPLGNKRYNDLVSEFSLQTLHQQFVITAKDFFQLNLNLLGSMVAAIVTYLVILIQFMLSERLNKDKIEPSLGTVEVEAMTTSMFSVDNSTVANSLFF